MFNCKYLSNVDNQIISDNFKFVLEDFSVKYQPGAKTQVFSQTCRLHFVQTPVF